MEEAYQLSVKKTPGIPVLVQRQSDDFWGPCDDYPLVEADNGDFEGEFAVIVDDTPMASSPEVCASKIRLVMILNSVMAPLSSCFNYPAGPWGQNAHKPMIRPLP